MNNRLQEIREKIRTINPAITDELLDLLCEYVKEANTPKGGGYFPQYVPYPQYYPYYYPINEPYTPLYSTYPVSGGGSGGGGHTVTIGKT